MKMIYEIYVRTSPTRLWEAITDPAIRANYNFGAGIFSDWTSGSAFELSSPGAGRRLGEGVNLEIDPPHRLVQSMTALWSEAVRGEGPSRITWQIERIEDSCHLTLVHDDLREGANAELYGGWPMILSGLKTWLETGERLTTPGSLRYAQSEEH